MAKSFTPAVVTAHDLVEGHAVFLGPEGWTAEVAGAMVALTADQAQEFEALARYHVATNTVVEPYLVDVALTDGIPAPILRREQIRASGAPTIPYGRAA